MSKILIFAGTTEGRKLSERLLESGIAHTICVATEYGEIVLKEHPLASIHRGRMNQEEISEYIKKGSYAAVVDATHPYADVITENIKKAVKGTELPCFCLKRETATKKGNGRVVYFDTSESCAEALKAVEGNILLTTGSKELPCFCVSKEVRKRLYVRILPGMESLAACRQQGIVGKQILALQGPFSTEMNEAMLHQYQIECLVTKESGRTGGYEEKRKAAERAGILLFVIGHPQEAEGDSFDEVCRKLEKISHQSIKQYDKLEITLAGIGMGSKNTMTNEVSQAIRQADILLGAERMLAASKAAEKKPFYRAEEIIPYLKEVQNRFALETGKVVVLFSGDSSFYSGCQSLYQALQEEIKMGTLKASVRMLPGVSSVSYLASCLGESCQDAVIYSMHGKELPNLIRKIKREEKLFLLMSGISDINRLGQLLLEAGLCSCEIAAGYQMSYPEQQIRLLTPAECQDVQEEGLYTCLIRNPHAEKRKLTHGMADTEFIRDKVPMTKEEVREVSICKLKLHKNAVVYDIGSGTGSIAVEIAGLSDDVRVFAIEKNEEAVRLTAENKKKNQLENIEVIAARAPEGFEKLPMPTHAFIGGSSGRLKEILTALHQKNSGMRVVINAISMETICEIQALLELYPIKNEEILQMQVSRVKKAGQYHLMQAENPVWICAFNFSKCSTENGFRKELEGQVDE